MSLEEKIKAAIRDIPDFPSPGIIFKDITPILSDPHLCKEITLSLAEEYNNLGVQAIAGVESRGFLFGMPVAMELGIPFILIRKKGKLPYKTIAYKYDLEYGSAEIEMHTDAVYQGMNVVIHDDLLATGGTANAAAELIKTAGGKVAGFSFLVELSFLNGKAKLLAQSQNILSQVSY